MRHIIKSPIFKWVIEKECTVHMDHSATFGICTWIYDHIKVICFILTVSFSFSFSFYFFFVLSVFFFLKFIWIRISPVNSVCFLFHKIQMIQVLGSQMNVDRWKWKEKHHQCGWPVIVGGIVHIVAVKLSKIKCKIIFQLLTLFITSFNLVSCRGKCIIHSIWVCARFVFVSISNYAVI